MQCLNIPFLITIILTNIQLLPPNLTQTTRAVTLSSASFIRSIKGESSAVSAAASFTWNHYTPDELSSYLGSLKFNIILKSLSWVLYGRQNDFLLEKKTVSNQENKYITSSAWITVLKIAVGSCHLTLFIHLFKRTWGSSTNAAS